MTLLTQVMENKNIIKKITLRRLGVDFCTEVARGTQGSAALILKFLAQLGALCASAVKQTHSHPHAAEVGLAQVLYETFHESL